MKCPKGYGNAFLAWLVLLLVLVWGGGVLQAGAALAAQEQPEKIYSSRHPQPEGWVAPDQKEARQRAMQKVEFIKDVLEESPSVRKQRLCQLGLGVEDIEHDYFLLKSPYVNTYEDQYRPVRFMHTQHAVNYVDSCAECHHYRPAGEGASETVRCAVCHQEPFKEEALDRVGLKAAYHLQCMGCHQQRGKGPVGCESCHRERSADHSELVALPAEPTPQQVTRECLRCHQEEGQEMLSSAHWLWRGPSTYIARHEREVGIGKGTKAINNF
jgi:hypothetical protein